MGANIVSLRQAQSHGDCPPPARFVTPPTVPLDPLGQKFQFVCSKQQWWRALRQWETVCRSRLREGHGLPLPTAADPGTRVSLTPRPCRRSKHLRSSTPDKNSNFEYRWGRVSSGRRTAMVLDDCHVLRGGGMSHPDARSPECDEFHQTSDQADAARLLKRKQILVTSSTADVPDDYPTAFC